MKFLILSFSFFLLFTSCRETKETIFDLNSFPKDWVSLTEKEGKLVIYNSCDAGNLLLKISKNRNNFDLILYGQQEDYEFKVLKSSQLNDTIYFKTKWKNSKKKQDFKFFWINKENEIGKFITRYSNGYLSENIFVTNVKQTRFEKIDQPCKECWGDECDEIENRVEKTNNSIEVIKNIFNEYIKYQESTDSQENKELLTKNIKSLDKVTKPEDLELLINVWMYYDPTDFSCRDLVINVLKNNRLESIKAIYSRKNNIKIGKKKRQHLILNLIIC